MKGQQDEA